jgi:mannose-1-phosphate guanylyltransferase
MAAEYGDERAAVILAGGGGGSNEGAYNTTDARISRLRYAPEAAGSKLLESTRRRVETAMAPEKIVLVINPPHERRYEAILGEVPKSNVVVQPEDKGTAPAILLGLLRIAAIAPDAAVAIFPADHYVVDERDFMRHVEFAFDAVERRPEFTVLLAMEPSQPGGSYEWIEPAQKIGFGTYDLYRVGSLWDRPDVDHAKRLLERGGLWNSGVIVGRLSTILGMIMVAAPQLYAAFAPLRARLPYPPTARHLATVYKDLAPIGFSQHVLCGAPVNLAVLPVTRARRANPGAPQQVRQNSIQLVNHG